MAENSTSLTDRLIRRSVDNCRLLWVAGHLDNDENDDLNFSTDKLRSFRNRIDRVKTPDDCLEFLSQHQLDRFILIVTGAVGQHTVPLIHHLPQVNSIIVQCHNKSRHESWTKNWPKIKSLCINIESLNVDLDETIRKVEQDSVSISIMGPGQTGGHDLNQLDPSFMYTQLMKEILLETVDDDNEDNMKLLVNYCRTLFANDAMELANVDRFEREFHDHTPIWWYTYNCFLFIMLNRSLRLFDAEVILKLGFFICLLHRQIEELHREQANDYQNEFHVYRGQGLSKSHFERLLQSKGGLLSFNNFLSTSKNRQVSLSFVYGSFNSSDSVGVLFNMSIDPRVSSTCFALLNNVSFYANVEEEILFSMNTVFRIGNIEPIDSKKQIWEVQLTLTLDDDPHLTKLIEQLRFETQGLNGWERLGRLTIKVGLFEKAEEIYRGLLELPQHEIIIAYFYFQLGSIKYQQGLYKASTEYHEKSLEIRLRNLPDDHVQIAMSYNGIGAAYHSLGHYPHAASYYEKALITREKSCNENDPSLVGLYNNLGILHMQMDDFTKSLSFFEKLLRIEESTSNPHHPNLALTYNNIGGLYEQMEDFTKAMLYHKKALDIRQRSLPSDHPDLAESYNNIAAVYLAMNDTTKALEFHQHALTMREKILSRNHPDLAYSYSNIGLVYARIKDYEKALDSHQNALKIRQENLPPNHPDLGTTYHNIATVYIQMGEFPKAFTYAERAVQIAEHSLPANHPNIQLFRSILDLAKNQM